MFSIGEFSKITGLSIKALRLYHDKELLVPNQVDESTSYRYYRDKDLERAKTITFLKGLTFSLGEIKEILSSFGDDAELVRVLEQKREVVDQKIQSLKIASNSIDKIIKSEKEAESYEDSQDFQIEEKEVDAYLIASIRWKGKYSEVGKIIGKLMKSAGMNVCGKPFNLYYDGEYKEDDADIQTCVPIRKGRDKDEVEVSHLSPTKCVSLIHKGDYIYIGRSYAKLFSHFHGKGLKPQLPYREIYIKGPGMILKGNPANYLTEIQMLVE